MSRADELNTVSNNIDIDFFDKGELCYTESATRIIQELEKERDTWKGDRAEWIELHRQKVKRIAELESAHVNAVFAAEREFNMWTEKLDAAGEEIAELKQNLFLERERPDRFADQVKHEITNNERAFIDEFVKWWTGHD